MEAKKTIEQNLAFIQLSRTTGDYYYFDERGNQRYSDEDDDDDVQDAIEEVLSN